MKSFVKELGRAIRSGLPFKISNTNAVDSELSKALVYKSINDAKNSGNTFIIGDEKTVYSGSAKIRGSNATSYITSNYDASIALLVDLDNHRFVWDWNEAKKLIRATSWYQELGPPPIRSLFVINNAGNALHWFDREDATLTPYMTFNTGGSSNSDCNMLGLAAASINSLYFKDFVMSWSDGSGNHGSSELDFIRDERKWWASEQFKYSGNISERNDGLGIDSYSPNPSLAQAATKFDMIMRDPDGLVDEYGRPQMWHVFGTNEGQYLYVSSSDTIYSSGWSSAGQPALGYPLAKSDNNAFVCGQYTVANGNFLLEYRDIVSLRTEGNGFREDTPYAFWSPPSSNGRSGIYWWYGSTTLYSADLIDCKSTSEGPITLHGYNQGYIISHTPSEGIDGDNIRGFNIYYQQGTIFTPPIVKGLCLAIYPLNDITDRTGHAQNLTNVSSVDFTTNDGPFGIKCATFNGTNKLERTGLSSEFDIPEKNGFYISFMAKINGVPPTTSYTAVSLQGTGPYPSLSIAFDTNGAPYATFTDNDGVVAGPVSGYDHDACDNEWHHIVYTVSRQNPSIGAGSGYGTVTDFDDCGAYLYLDGKLVAYNNNVNGAIANIHPDQIIIGNQKDSSTPFTGQLAQFSISKSYMTHEEVEFEYNRMKLALAGKTFFIPPAGVDYISADPDNNTALLVSNNTPYLIDATNGLLLDTYSNINVGTIKDVDLISRNGSSSSSYVVAGTTGIAVVEPATSFTGE